MRQEQIAAAIASGATTVDQIVAKVYPDISEAVRRAAEETVRAHLENW
jgi:O-phosphoseryl-tRNA(Cys) synthetase